MTPEPPNPLPPEHPEFYNMDGYSWDKIWTYRRIFSTDSNVNFNDLTIQNWGRGNDFAFGYLFLSKNETRSQVEDWMGGIDIDVLSRAERIAYGWHYWFKNQSDIIWKDHVTLDKSVLGTCHGLAKVPYIRDTRRSIGLDGFIMKISDISGI